MRFAEAVGAILLWDEGRTILSTAGVEVDPLSWLEVEIVESEDLGLWIKSTRAGEPRVLLVRWDFILAVDLEAKLKVVRFGLG